MALKAPSRSQKRLQSLCRNQDAARHLKISSANFARSWFFFSRSEQILGAQGSCVEPGGTCLLCRLGSADLIRIPNDSQFHTPSLPPDPGTSWIPRCNPQAIHGWHQHQRQPFFNLLRSINVWCLAMSRWWSACSQGSKEDPCPDSPDRRWSRV